MRQMLSERKQIKKGNVLGGSKILSDFRNKEVSLFTVLHFLAYFSILLTKIGTMSGYMSFNFEKGNKYRCYSKIGKKPRRFSLYDSSSFKSKKWLFKKCKFPLEFCPGCALGL